MLRDFHFPHFAFNKELKELYANHAIRAFGFSLISVFVPIYLLRLGHSVPEVFVFYAILYATMLAGYAVSVKLMQRIGTKHTIAISMPLLILFYALLMTINSHGISVFLLAALYGVHDGVYWLAYHTDFALFTRKRKSGEAVGVLHALPQVAAIAGPVTGAFVISTISFEALFVAAIIIFAASVLPLFMTRDRRLAKAADAGSVLSGRSRREAIGIFGYGVKSTGYVFWPIAIFLALGSVVAIGEAMSGMIFFVFLLNIAIGELSDRHNPQAIMRIGGLLDAGTWVVKAGASNFLSIFGISAVGGMTEAVGNVPYWKKIYDSAKRGNVVEYFLFMEAMLAAGRVFALLFAALVLAGNLQLALLLAGVGALGYLVF